MAEYEKLLEVKNLYVEYHSSGRVVHSVNGLDLSIGEGETLGFVGETGAGKTSTALAILRILPQPLSKVTSGQLIYKGKDLMEYDAKTMRQKLSTSTPMRLLAISLESADTVQSAATHSDMISPKYIITFN